MIIVIQFHQFLNLIYDKILYLTLLLKDSNLYLTELSD